MLLVVLVLLGEEFGPPDTWAAGVAPSLDSLALVVLWSMQCCHDAVVPKKTKKNKTTSASQAMP